MKVSLITLCYRFNLIFDLLLRCLLSALYACFESLFVNLSVCIAYTDSEMLKYAYAELEEARGAIQVFILATWFSL